MDRRNGHEIACDGVLNTRPLVIVRIKLCQRDSGAQRQPALAQAGGLPVHGQRTHTNARTRKGPAKPIAGKKKVTK